MVPTGQIERTGLSHHITRPDWLNTPTRQQRGYIDPQLLKELWFHTGTVCNLSCPFCLEGSKPGDDRLNKITLEDVRPFIDEALGLGVERFSFTGGEPFIIKDMIRVLDHALQHRPCLVLTNATAPLQRRMGEVAVLTDKPNPLNFRVSIDHPDEARHDSGRGPGNFELAWRMVAELHKRGFPVSIAWQRGRGEDTEKVNKAYGRYLRAAGLPLDTRIVSFPDFFAPGAMADVPHITEDCMTRYHTPESRGKFMCSFSKMVVKKEGRMRVYACTLVDDDGDYDLGDSLNASMRARVMLKHHRCYSCFAQGASCSEM